MKLVRLSTDIERDLRIFRQLSNQQSPDSRYDATILSDHFRSDKNHVWLPPQPHNMCYSGFPDDSHRDAHISQLFDTLVRVFRVTMILHINDLELSRSILICPLQQGEDASAGAMGQNRLSRCDIPPPCFCDTLPGRDGSTREQTTVSKKMLADAFERSSSLTVKRGDDVLQKQIRAGGQRLIVGSVGFEGFDVLFESLQGLEDGGRGYDIEKSDEGFYCGDGLGKFWIGGEEVLVGLNNVEVGGIRRLGSFC